MNNEHWTTPAAPGQSHAVNRCEDASDPPLGGGGNGDGESRHRQFPRHRRLLPQPLVLAGLLQACCLCTLRAAEPVAAPAAPRAETAAARSQRLFRQANARWQQDTNALEPAWQFAGACFDRAEYSLNDGERAEIAQLGMTAAHRALHLDPRSAPAAYYLGLNLGQLAQTRSLGALKLVGQMETTFKRSIELDEKFDFAGAHRSLGMLYRDAPGWPTSIGDRSKARRHLTQAVHLFPGYPDNQISLLEAELKWGERKTVATHSPHVAAILEHTRQELKGEEWDAAWKDWDTRWEKIQATAGKTDAKKQ